ncbi:S9 family peptidase [Paeniglutamicibacter cryotolerans]|uniref:Dipeptidyl aminopeptidase/acylaminoacyl peptidase n=1 Tax=Paeniglutamicibacter cryotolerans TaxID=670079 RepID=A0A839QLC9_9MICC|nr:S9 family peptidase [Paeniglutamicibacter cryotolerans]MBB2997228.1 dipeptidyl aminopeptidase/acylaminoacyl peptidase [Paeniglutamicibacter cryotolerans]
MKPAQLELMTTVSVPTISPDGRHAVVATSRASFDSDGYVGQLWMLHLDGGAEPRRLTRGTSDSAPRYSPDGSLIAFLRADAKGRPQVAITRAGGGEPQLLTNRKLGVGSFVWSPDGTRIAFTSRTPEPGRYGTVEGVDAGAEDPRHITTLKYRGNGVGWIRDKVASIFVLDVPDPDGEPFITAVGRAAAAAKEAGGETPTGFPSARRLTGDDTDAGEPAFSPDGTQVYYTAAHHEGADTDLRSMIYRVPAAQLSDAEVPGELVLGSEHGQVAYGTPAFSGDGATLFVLGAEVGPDGTDFVARCTGVHAVPVAGLPTLDATLLTNTQDTDYGDVQSTLIASGSDSVLAFARVRGSGELHKVSAVGKTEVLSSGPRVITGAAEADGTIVVSYADSMSPGECGVLQDGALEPLTDFASALRAGTRIVAGRELTVASGDGYPVHGWVFLPEEPGPHPVLLNIHGGPFSQYGWDYFDEAQVYAAAGYAVLQCNPRGSASYGREHGLAIKGAMGTVDLDDVLAFFEGAVAAEPRLDATRAGVLGGSYGGYLTAWTIANDHRFTAAIVERGYLDPFSFIGSSDIGWFFSEAYTGTDEVAVREQSPFAKLHQVKTPTLVMHSEEDYRCPLEQAQRYYVGLKRAGVDTEMLLFPGENHELSRSGTPWHRKARFEAILDWWERYLPVAGDAAPADA